MIIAAEFIVPSDNLINAIQHLEEAGHSVTDVVSVNQNSDSVSVVIDSDDIDLENADLELEVIARNFNGTVASFAESLND